MVKTLHLRCSIHRLMLLYTYAAVSLCLYRSAIVLHLFKELLPALLARLASKLCLTVAVGSDWLLLLTACLFILIESAQLKESLPDSLFLLLSERFLSLIFFYSRKDCKSSRLFFIFQIKLTFLLLFFLALSHFLYFPFSLKGFMLCLFSKPCPSKSSSSQKGLQN